MEQSGACGESKVRRGLSGTKLQIHMICLAKRVKEKWIKAWRDQRNATIKSRRLPWDQQEMHIIYKLFFDCQMWRELIVIVWRMSCWWRGLRARVIIAQWEEYIFSLVLNSSCLWSVSEAAAEAPSTHDNRQQDRHKDNFCQPRKYLISTNYW